MAENQSGGVPAPGADEISLNVPRKSGKDLYLFRAFNQVERFNQYISTIDYSKPLRIKVIVRSCLMMIPDDLRREELWQAYTDASDFVNSYNVDNTDRIDLQLECAIRTVAEFVSYLDEFVGISRTNTLVPMVSEPSDMVKEATKDILEMYSKGEMTEGAPLE